MRHTADAFCGGYERIMDGSFTTDLLSASPASLIADALSDIAMRHVFRSKPIFTLEIAANTMIDFLLDRFVPAAVTYGTDEPRGAADDKLIGIISENYRHIYSIYSEGRSEEERLYLRLLLVTDFICGMTDSYAKRVYQELNGIV